MKSNSPTDHPKALPVWAGWAALLLLILAECWVVCQFGNNCWQAMVGQDDIGTLHADVAMAFR
jgi:hypothetical protein